MPKVEYYYAIPVTCIGYMLGYDVFGILVASLIIFWLYNSWTDFPKDFGYVRKEKYLKLKAENEENFRKLKILSDYILKMNEQEKGKTQDTNRKGQYRSYNRNEPNTKDWCKTLNVSAKPTKEEVDQAYKALVKVYHPDINKDPNARDRMYKINEAKAQADKYFANT